MKYNALQFTRQHLQEAKQYQESDMNVAEYLLLNVQSYLEYLTDEEIEEFETNSERREELEKKVEAFIKENFDFDFEEFEY